MVEIGRDALILAELKKARDELKEDHEKERKILELESNAQRDSILLSQQTKQIRELESSLA